MTAIVNRSAVYFKTEGTPGTFETFNQSTDRALEVFNLKYELYTEGAGTYTDQTSVFGGVRAGRLGAVMWKVGFQMKLPRWPGSRNQADFPEFAALLLAGPHVLSFATSDAVLTLTSAFSPGTYVKPVSMLILEQGGNEVHIAGATFCLKDLDTSDGYIIATFEGGGLYSSVVEIGTNYTTAAVVVRTVSLLVAEGGTLTLSGLNDFDPVNLEGVKLELGEKWAPTRNQLATHGFGIPTALIGDGVYLRPTFDRGTEAQQSIIADFMAESAVTASIAYTGLTVALPASRISAVAPVDIDGRDGYELEIPGDVSSSNGVTITFT